MEFASRSRKIRRSCEIYNTEPRWEFLLLTVYMTLDLAFTNLASNNPGSFLVNHPTTLGSSFYFYFYCLFCSSFSLTFRIEKLSTNVSSISRCGRNIIDKGIARSNIFLCPVGSFVGRRMKIFSFNAIATKLVTDGELFASVFLQTVCVRCWWTSVC